MRRFANRHSGSGSIGRDVAQIDGRDSPEQIRANAPVEGKRVQLTAERVIETNVRQKPKRRVLNSVAVEWRAGAKLPYKHILAAIDVRLQAALLLLQVSIASRGQRDRRASLEQLAGIFSARIVKSRTASESHSTLVSKRVKRPLV